MLFRSKSIYFGALPALMAELFPVATRATGMSIGYNIGVTVFGGFTPMITVWLLSATGNRSAPGFYLMFTATVSLVALAGVARSQSRRVGNMRGGASAAFRTDHTAEAGIVADTQGGAAR